MGPRVNERIRAREIRVIDETGGQLGILTPREALDIARERGLDLIEVAPNAQPPVCRIMDYGKYKYEQGKREREAAKKQRQSEMKGISLRPVTDDHDLEIKTKNILRFLSDGDKVKVTVKFKSRELSHPEFAQAALEKIMVSVQEAGTGVVERPAMMEGKQMIMILAPQREGAPKKPSAPKAPKSDENSKATAAPETTSKNGDAPTTPVPTAATPQGEVATAG
jgi:translation initiation factor IF-3